MVASLTPLVDHCFLRDVATSRRAAPEGKLQRHEPDVVAGKPVIGECSTATDAISANGGRSQAVDLVFHARWSHESHRKKNSQTLFSGVPVSKTSTPEFQSFNYNKCMETYQSLLPVQMGKLERVKTGHTFPKVIWYWSLGHRMAELRSELQAKRDPKVEEMENMVNWAWKTVEQMIKAPHRRETGNLACVFRHREEQADPLHCLQNGLWNRV